MKKAFKFLALLLICAITVVSLPKVQLSPKADETANQTTYTFKFDGEDLYNFYEKVDTATGYGPAFTNNYAEGVVSPSKSTYGVTKNPYQSKPSAEPILGSELNTNVGAISAVSKSGETGLKGGELGNFVSPDSRIFENSYLVSGSFDICLGRAARYTPVWVFGQDEEKNYLFRIGVRVGDKLYHRESALTFDKYSAAWGQSNGLFSKNANVLSDEVWLHYEFSYNSEEKLKVSVTSSDGTTEVFVSESAIPKEYRAFALTTSYYGSGDRSIYFDNVELNIAPEDVVKTVEYDFETDSPVLVTDAYTEHKHDNATVSYSVKINSGMLNLVNNHVGVISKVTKKSTADTVANGNMSEFVSPLKSVFEKYKNEKIPRYLASGGFDMYFSGDARTNEAFVFGLDDTSYQYGILTVNRGYIKSSAFSQSLTEEATNWSYNQHQGLSGSSEAKWYHIDFKYTEDNRVSVKVTNKNDESCEWTYDIAVEAENRIFAFTSPYHGNGREFYVDNLVLNFAPEGILADYPVPNRSEEVQNCIDLIKKIGTVTPASGDAIENAKAAYEALGSNKVFVVNSSVLENAIESFAQFGPIAQKSSTTAEKSTDLTFSFTAPVSVFEGYTLTEMGTLIIENSKIKDANDITLDNSQCKKYISEDLTGAFSVTEKVTDADTVYSAKAYSVLKNTTTNENYIFYSSNSNGIVVNGTITGSVNDLIRGYATLLINSGEILTYTASVTKETNIAQIGDSNTSLDSLYEFVTANKSILNELNKDTVNINLMDKYVKLLGRYGVTDNTATFVDTNSGFTFDFVGGGDIVADLTGVNSESYDAYFKVFVDGKVTADFKIGNSTATYTLASNLPYGKHTVTAVKRTKPDKILVSNIKLSAGSYICGITPKKARRIEFLGDSISAGYDNLDLGKLYQNADSRRTQHNYDSTQTFSWYLGEYYDADIYCRAIPGAGVAWGGGGGGGGIDYLTDRNGSAWDFENNPVDLVCINLGTNCNGGLNKKPENTVEAWTEAAIELLKTVRSKNPNAKILWSYGCMGNQFEGNIINAIEQYKSETGDNAVEYLSIRGAASSVISWHPTNYENYSFAEQMIPAIESLMPEWKCSFNFFGDANDDGECNIADLLRIKKNLAGVTDKIKVSNVDFDFNDSVDGYDTSVLCKHLLGLEVEDNITQYKIIYKDVYAQKNYNPTLYTAAEGDDIILMPPENLQGYEFLGWYDSENNPITSLTGKTGQIEITAKWKQIIV